MSNKSSHNTPTKGCRCKWRSTSLIQVQVGAESQNTAWYQHSAALWQPHTLSNQPLTTLKPRHFCLTIWGHVGSGTLGWSGAIKIVSDNFLTFYSSIFVVEKALGRMEMISSVLTSIRKGDMMISVGLNDKCLQISIHLKPRLFWGSS